MIGAILAGTYGGGALAGDFESIATVLVGSGGSASIDFQNIPGTFQHLQLRYIARDNRAGTNSDDIFIRVNNDATTGNYNSHRLLGNGGGGAPSSDRVTGYAGVLSAFVAASTAGASRFGAGVTDFLDYSNGNKNKVSRSLGGFDDNGSGFSTFISGLWMSTSVITRLTVYPLNGTSFDQNSHFALYGIRG